MPEPLAPALSELRTLLLDPDTLVRAIASGRRRNETVAWRRVEIRPVDIKAGRRLQTVAYDERQAHTSNAGYGPEAESAVDALLATPFGNWRIESVGGTVELRVTKSGDAMVHRSKAAAEQRLEHDRAKTRHLDPADPLWRALGIADASGTIKPTRQDKYRQVEAFVQQLDAVLKPESLPHNRALRVVDLGCGNAYLTFAAYRFLTEVRGLEVDFTGVDVKRQAAERNTAIAAELGCDGMRFVEGTIADAAVDAPDVVLALHACDTATDDALARAVQWQAPFVLAAPCCHHDLQKQIKRHGAPAPYDLLGGHGILRERFADVLTDALRAAILRQQGYRVEVVEFVASEHTPRNTMLRAVRTGAAPDPAVGAEYDALTAAWGVRPKLQELID